MDSTQSGKSASDATLPERLLAAAALLDELLPDLERRRPRASKYVHRCMDGLRAMAITIRAQDQPAP